jgi:hypothetical protein
MLGCCEPGDGVRVVDGAMGCRARTPYEHGAHQASHHCDPECTIHASGKFTPGDLLQMIFQPSWERQALPVLQYNPTDSCLALQSGARGSRE